MEISDLVAKCKKANDVTDSYFDDEMTDVVNDAIADLGFAIDAEKVALTDQSVVRYIVEYSKAHFGHPDSNEYDRLIRSLDEQKAQMQMSGRYIA
jgi:hypothetical protein